MDRCWLKAGAFRSLNMERELIIGKPIMKKLAGVFAVVALGVVMVGLNGCTDPIAAKQDPLTTYPQVHMASQWLADNTRVQSVQTSIVGSGQLRVDIIIRNLTNDPLTVDYQYSFLNNRGMDMEGRHTGITTTIPPRGPASVTFTSMSSGAANFDVEFRYRK